MQMFRGTLILFCHKLVDPLLMAAPISTITVMKQVVDGKAGEKNPMLSSKRGAYDHFTPKEMAGMANWDTTNLQKFKNPYFQQFAKVCSTK